MGLESNTSFQRRVIHCCCLFFCFLISVLCECIYSLLTCCNCGTNSNIRINNLQALCHLGVHLLKISLVGCIHGNCVMGPGGEVIKKLTDVLAD